MRYLNIGSRLKTGFISILSVGGVAGLVAGTPSVKPNIIIILADDQGWGDMGYNGHPVIQTPNFDAMSEAGLQLDRFYAAAPVSSPTRGSILTGRHPNRFGCFTWGHTLPPSETTIAERLQDAGYRTGHFGKWHLGTVYKNSPTNPGSNGFDEWFSSPNFFESDPILSKEGIAVQTQGESSMVTMKAAIEFIENNAKENPFFAYVCFGSPHQPHVATEQDRMPYLFLEKQFQHYYGEIGGMDRAVGMLRTKLREMGIEENTVVWYLSDNGGLRDSERDPDTGERKYLSSTGGREYKSSIYEGGLRVPGIIEWPGRIKGGSSSNFPSFTSDIYPTLLDIAGIELKEEEVVDGISLLPLVDERLNSRDEPLAFWKFPAAGKPVHADRIMKDLLERQQKGIDLDPEQLMHDGGTPGKRYTEDDLYGHAAWLNWPFKLHRICNENEEPVYELYHLEEDPWEEFDLSSQHAHLLTSMASDLHQWMLSVINSLNGNDY